MEKREDAANTCGEICNLLYSRAYAQRFVNATGQEIVKAIESISEARNYISHHPLDANAVATDLIKSHMEAVSVRGGDAVTKALKNGADLHAAVLAGVGVSDIAGFVQMICELFQKLMEKEKKCIGLIVNDTDFDIQVKNWKLGFNEEDSRSDLYLPHGRMQDFMSDNTVSPAVQIRKRSGNNVYCGLYLMTKRDSALVGVESTMRLTLIGSGQTISYLSCCPYTQDNRVNLRANRAEPLSKLHDEMYSDKRKDAVVTAGTITAQARVNSYGGSPSYCILSIVQP